jgi:hypothetical protein
VGGIQIGDALRARIESAPENERRTLGWRIAKAIAVEARQVGFAGIVIMGLRFETAVGEAYQVWHDDAVAPLDDWSAVLEQRG